MSLAVLGVALLFQCKGLPPASVPPPQANSSACGIRFWRPSGWAQEVSKVGDSWCQVGLMPPGWRRDHGKSDYALRLSVHIRKSTFKPRPDASPLSDLGFQHDKLGWHAEGSTPGQKATEIEGQGWKGVTQYIQFSAYDENGRYRGVGEGQAAGLIGPGNALIYAEAHVGIYDENAFDNLLCSIHFGGRPSAK